MVTYAYAEAQATSVPKQPLPIMNLVPILGMLVIFYFFLLRPQQKRASEHKKMLEKLEKGEMVITSGGIYGTVVSVGETTAEIKVADNVKIKILKSAVSEKVHSQESANGKTPLLGAQSK